MRRNRIVLAAIVTAAVLWGGYRAYRAHANLVTLSVRNMDVRKVVSKLEWQTWERIVVSKDVGGKVTLRVKSVPLEEVLNIVGLQTDSRWTRLYPIYSTKKSWTAFNQALLGTVSASSNGWSSLQQLSSWQQVSMGGFASALRAENKLVSAQLANKDVAFAALALSRFSKAQVVPEDDTKGLVSLRLQEVPFEKAVAKVAKQVKRKWGRVYTLQPLNGPSINRQQVVAAAPATNAIVVTDTNQAPSIPGPGGPALPPERAWEALASTMTPEEQQQTLQQFAGAIPNAAPGAAGGGQQQLPPGDPGAAQAAQAQAAQAAQAAQQDLERRINLRLKDGTVDQRIAHDRRVLNQNQAGEKR